MFDAQNVIKVGSSLGLMQSTKTIQTKHASRQNNISRQHYKLTNNHNLDMMVTDCDNKYRRFRV